MYIMVLLRRSLQFSTHTHNTEQFFLAIGRSILKFRHFHWFKKKLFAPGLSFYLKLKPCSNVQTPCSPCIMKRVIYNVNLARYLTLSYRYNYCTPKVSFLLPNVIKEIQTRGRERVRGLRQQELPLFRVESRQSCRDGIHDVLMSEMWTKVIHIEFQQC